MTGMNMKHDSKARSTKTSVTNVEDIFPEPPLLLAPSKEPAQFVRDERHDLRLRQAREDERRQRRAQRLAQLVVGLAPRRAARDGRARAVPDADEPLALQLAVGGGDRVQINAEV